MQRTYDVPLVRAGLVATVVTLLLLALPGTSIAGGAPKPTPSEATAGLLQFGAGYGAPGEAPRVRAVQRKLRSLGWRPGRLDGLFGPRTEAAVTRFQMAAGLAADGIVGPHTRRALQRAVRYPLHRGAGYAAGGSPQVKALQRELRRKGLTPGPVDGLYGPRTEAAVARLQQRAGLPAKGVVDARTRRALDTAALRAPSRRASQGRRADEPSRRADRRSARPDRAERRARQGQRADEPSRRADRRSARPDRAERPVSQGGQADQSGRRASRPDTPGDRADRGADRRSGLDPLPTPSPTQTPTPIALTNHDQAEDQTAWLVLAALMALILGGIAGLLIGRMRSGPQPAPAVALARGVVAEGMAKAGSVGRFRGHVHALVLGRQGLRRTQEARYLISDPDKALPFWVDQDEIERLGREEPDQRPAPAEDHPETEAEAAPAQPDAESPKEQQAAASQPAPNEKEEPAVAQPAHVQDRPPHEDRTQNGHLQPAPASNSVRALGYVSVEQNGDPELGDMRAQAEVIDALCRSQGWRLLEVVRDVDSVGGGSLRRPGLAYAVEKIARGEASCLVVSQLSRLTNSAADLSRVLESLARTNARLVVVDVGLDTASEAGRIAATSLLKVGAWERQRMLESTRKGLEAARAKRAAAGQPAVEDVPALKQRILDMREEGLTLQAIADQLNEEGVPTIRGGQLWRPSSVQAALGYRRPRRRRDQGGHPM
jgi:peptidoglycan hydrolase-like protein with peptidoglycan-binding domain/DNA invertase Pin-like site-specific DNA recombinase